MKASTEPLPYRIRAEIFQQLYQLEAGGVPYTKAVSIMAVQAPAAERLKAMQGLAARGIDAAKAGEQSGLFTKLDARLVRAALNAGSPARVYQRLAAYYAKRAMQWTSIRSRMMLPALMLGLALFIQPLPALVSGAISFGSYAWQVVWPMLLIAGIVVVLRWLWLHQVPIYGPIFVRTNLRDFFESLALLLDAGVPMLDALPAASDTVIDGGIRRALAAVRQRVEKGETFTAALESVPHLRRSTALAFANTGEQSGTLPEMLMRYADMETEAIAGFYKQLAAWLPRIVYALVAIKIVMGIFSSGGVVPRVPTDL